MPVRPGDFEYRFSPDALVDVRGRLGLSQAKLAQRLDLPVNTVSRWERGETTPDANSLAAIYSIAMEQGLSPEFFRRQGSMTTAQKKPRKPLNGRQVLNSRRSRLVMIWDFQNVPLDAETAREVWFYMYKYLDIAFPNVERWELKVYASWEHKDAVANLDGFDDVFDEVQAFGDADDRIEQDTRNLCGISRQETILYGVKAPWNPVRVPATLYNPLDKPWSTRVDSKDTAKDTVLVFVSKDGDFANLLYDVDDAGVDVYLWASPGCSNDLIDAVRSDHIIPWSHPRTIVSQDNLRRHRR